MSSVSTWVVIIASMSIALCFFSAALVLARHSHRQDQDRFLAAFLVLFGALKLDQLYLRTGGYEVLPHLAGIAYSLDLFLPPVMYFYARSLTHPSAQWFEKKDLWALFTPALAALIASPYYLLSANQKIALMDPQTRDPQLYERAVLGCQIGLLLFIVTAIVYLTLSFKRFNEHTSRLYMLFSRIDDKQISWLRWVSLVLFFGWTGYALSELWLLTGTQPPGVYLATMVFELAFISFFAFQGINQKPVYHTQAQNLLKSDTNLGGGTESLYAKSGLTQADRQRIADKLNDVMAKESLFKDPDLSLRMLSERIAVSDVRISETFSQHMNTNFFDFVNSFRVEEACALLKSTQQKVLAVALDSGFNSRSTFSTAFKKHTGQTPSQYRSSTQENSLLKSS